MNEKITNLAALILVSAAVSATAGDGLLNFPGTEYPLTLQFSAQRAQEEGVFETPLSAAPEEAYNTLLIQGKMPAGLVLEVLVKSQARPGDFESVPLVASKRFRSDRFWAKYRLERRARHQVKLRAVNRGSGNRLVIYEVKLVKKEEPEWSDKTAPPEIYVPGPEPLKFPFKITLREDWHAAAPGHAFIADTPRLATLHHTAGNYPADYKEAAEEIGFIQDYHQSGEDIDIGYHFLISPQGDIFEGRPLGTLGAHSSKRNTGNVGISVMGNYQKESAARPVTPEALAAIAAIGKYLRENYAVSISSFYGHRDINQTLCPGAVLYSKMPEIKNLISPPAAPVTWTPVAPGPTPFFLPAPAEIHFN